MEVANLLRRNWRNDAAELNGDGSSGDTERNARDAAALKGIDDSSPSKEKSVTVLAIVLLGRVPWNDARGKDLPVVLRTIRGRIEHGASSETRLGFRDQGDCNSSIRTSRWIHASLEWYGRFL